MANKAIVEEVKNFIRYAVKNRINRNDDEKNWTEEGLAEFDEQLIKMLLSGVKQRKSDISLCEYAKLVAKSKGVELPESIRYWIILLSI